MSTQTSAVVLLAMLASVGLGDEPRRLPPIDASAVEIAHTATHQPLVAVAWEGDTPPAEPRYEVGALFDKGVFIRGVDLQRDPYAMYIGARLQLRHTGFTRTEEEWTDSAGVTREIRNRNNFDSERVRLNIQGTALDPDMTYYFVIDGDSDGASTVDMLLYFFTYKFADELKVRVGRWKVASDREWLLSSRYSTLVDRSMANEYFRSGFSDGVWVLGNLTDDFRYEASLTNGLRSSTRRPFELDDNLSAATTVIWEPLGKFGPGFVDYACHKDPVVQIGGSFAFDKSDDRSDVGFPLGDDGFLRLSDGTRLSEVGALGDGSRLLSDQVFKANIDFAVKWRGCFASTEFYLRSIQALKADGPIEITQIDDHGFRCDVGTFLVPKRWDILGRVSHVNGPYGDAWEWAGGVNYYWGNGKRDGKLSDRINKFSFDVTYLDGSPTSSAPADLIAGDQGVLFRTQVQIGF